MFLLRRRLPNINLLRDFLHLQAALEQEQSPDNGYHIAQLLIVFDLWLI